MNILKRFFKKTQVPEWRKHPNPYLELHLLVYPEYLEKLDNGTYDSTKDPFCLPKYILSHPFRTFEDVKKEVSKWRG